ncbi:Fpg/Nei family DNA glycosylase [Paludibaculum fermentans]|uniref:Formamidopyrimidine-DNA glycosylase n=1 Tax=Paludibaculum fermentans TaxID=1473598 RepID=A0A7S7NX62_PALFE|nr:DNA-formamidopyrimidine glycosylase family protein [Paludibaculum fermentans]QOY91443.1 formamidopyrimidine-DNA glycosylase [Paludibaculum fermentans]
MPELPDIQVYIEALEARVLNERLERVEFKTPFLLRTVTPPVKASEGQVVRRLRRVGKRIAFGFGNDVWMVLHLMIAGRLHWQRKAGKVLASFVFSSGTLNLTEAGTQHRASLHMAQGEEGVRALDPGGLEPLECTLAEFMAALRRENHTLKRSLTDPHLFSGIGNAYSDEILQKARLSPVALSQKLSDADLERLYEATKATLVWWTDRLRAEAGGGFPEKVTAFREEMAVHGKFKKPCPECGTTVQRIRYASNETNYCPRCQTGGRLLADRSLSRLLGSDWPKSIDDLP